MPTSTGSGFGRLDGLALNTQGRRAGTLHHRTETRDDPQQHLDVPDPRDVVQLALFLGQEARREQRQRGVLVSLDRDRAGQPPASSISNVAINRLPSRVELIETISSRSCTPRF